MYHAIHKKSGRIVHLEPAMVNDIFEDAAGRFVICSTEMEVYWLIADVALLDEI